MSTSKVLDALARGEAPERPVTKTGEDLITRLDGYVKEGTARGLDMAPERVLADFIRHAVPLIEQEAREGWIAPGWEPDDSDDEVPR